MTNHRVSKLLALLLLINIAGCVVRSTPSHTVYRERSVTHDHRR